MDRRALVPSYESFTRSDTEPTNYLSVLAIGTSSCGVVESSEANDKGDRDGESVDSRIREQFSERDVWGESQSSESYQEKSLYAHTI